MNREAELKRPSRVGCSVLLGVIVYSPTLDKSYQHIIPNPQSLVIPASNMPWGQALRLKVWAYMWGLWRTLSCLPGSVLIRLALRWPSIEPLLPTVQRHARWAALFDRFSFEAAYNKSPSRPALTLGRGLLGNFSVFRSYRDEWDKLVVLTPNESKLSHGHGKPDMTQNNPKI